MINDQFSYLSSVIRGSSFKKLVPENIADVVRTFLSKLFILLLFRKDFKMKLTAVQTWTQKVSTKLFFGVNDF